MPADDPQAGYGPGRFPALRGVVAVADGATVRLGGVAFTAHHMPGHAPGATSWSWRGCEAGRCATLVFGDSLNPVAAPGFRFGDGAHAATFRASIARMQALPCDLLVAAHPGQSRLSERLAAREAGDADALLDHGCRAYAEEAAHRLDARLAEEGAPAAD
jgi:metallo-beta-lactamase class B